MSESPIVVSDPVGSRDNEVRPFAIEGMDVRGRAVRLGTVVDRALATGDYPDPVARILGEVATLAVLLGSALKTAGVVTVQTKAEGPVPLMVADYAVDDTGPGRLRAYAQIDEDKLRTYGKNPSFKGLVGSKKGYMALTIDQADGGPSDRYQGIVELATDSLADTAVNYFKNSEQTPTAMILSCERDAVTGHWRAGGIMVQHLSRGEEGATRLHVRREDYASEDNADDWRRAQILMESVRRDELLNPSLDLDQLLFRLYHEDGVRVFEASHAEFGCRCSREKIERVIAGFSKDDLDHMTVDGSITVDCRFCGSSHIFDPADLTHAH